MFWRACLTVALILSIQIPLSAEVIGPGKSGSELRELLRQNFTPARSLSYSDARERMFSDIDNVNGKVRLVYTGSEFSTSTTPNHQVVNTEHTWPQSKFRDGIQRWKMKTDLHHLYPTWSRVNSARGSFPFGEIPDTSTAKWWNSQDASTRIPTSKIDHYSESITGVFEPREDHKGNVARSMFYFYVIYEHRSINLTWFNPQIPTLLQWHFDDPADDTERARTEAIGELQGNLNPFVVDETLASRIFGATEDEGGSPSPFAASAGRNDEADAGIPGLRVRTHRHTETIAATAERDVAQAEQDESVLDAPLFPFEHFDRRDNNGTGIAPFAASASGPDDGEIRLATFNIANFGATSEYKRSLIALTNILLKTNADLVCLQEIQPNSKGKDQVRRLKELLNEAADFYNTKPYKYKVSQLDQGDELTAFLWRRPVVLDSNIESFPHDTDHDNDGKRSFQRVPQMAAFHAGEFDFVVVNCHLYTKPYGNSSEGRIVENGMLANWLKSVAANSGGEQDAIVLGDLNRHLGNGGDTAWTKLMVNNHQQFFRFPLLEAIKNDHSGFNPLAHRYAPTDEYSTTASKSKNIYDQIVISKGCYAEYVSNPGFGVDVGVVDFDNHESFEWFAHNYELTSDYLTDHRPVWIDLRFDVGDDD